MPVPPHPSIRDVRKSHDALPLLPPPSGCRTASAAVTPLCWEGGLAGQTAPAFSGCWQLPRLAAVAPCREEEPRRYRWVLAAIGPMNREEVEAAASHEAKEVVSPRRRP